MSTIVVTRPLDDAATLAGALRHRGHDVVVFPVLGIEPVDDPEPLDNALARLADYGLVVFVSPNAIRHAVARLPGAWPHAVAIGVMGPGSVAALAALGIAAPARTVVSPRDGMVSGDPTGPRFDSEALVAALGPAIGLGQGFAGRVLIVRGNGGRAWLGERLRALGLAVDEVESYRRTQPPVPVDAADGLRRLFADDGEATFVVTSSEGLDHLVTMVVDGVLAGVDTSRASAWLHRQPIVAPHARIAEKARSLGFTDVSLTGPGDAGITAAIG